MVVKSAIASLMEQLVLWTLAKQNQVNVAVRNLSVAEDVMNV